MIGLFANEKHAITNEIDVKKIEQIIDKILTDEYMDFCNNIGSAIKKQESRFRNPRNSAKIGRWV